MKMNLETAKQYTFAFCLMAFIVSITNGAFAAPAATDGGQIATVMCKVVAALQGPIGKSIATIGIVVLGIGLFMGKLSWPLALATALGIGLIFGADTIITWLGGPSGGCPTS